MKHKKMNIQLSSIHQNEWYLKGTMKVATEPLISD